MLASATDAATSGREDDIVLFARVVADALKESVMELRTDGEARMSQFTTAFLREFSTFCGGEEGRTVRLEKAIADLKPPARKIDPITNFWTIYKKVSDEHDNDMVSKYLGDLDTSLLFAGLFSAANTTFIAQIIPQLQPNPVNLTNILLLQLLQQNTSIVGNDLQAPDSGPPIGVIRAQSILFASLSITLVVAFISVLGKQWILYYTRVTRWGNVVDRGKEHQVKLMGLQKWGLHFIMESLPVMLQFALLLFGIALAVYLWDLNVSFAEVVLVTSAGLAFYTCVTVVATIWRDCPFQTPFSILLPRAWPLVKEFTALARVRLKRWLRRKATLWVERLTKRNRLPNPPGHAVRAPIDEATTPNLPGEDTADKDHPMTLSNPAFWRHDPIFTSPLPKDISASAGFWLLENSTDYTVASSVAATFSEIQWPSHHRSTTALIRLRDTYVECFRAPEFNKSTRLKALQSAAAYYVLYHTQFIWSTSKSFEIEIEKLPPDLPSDLFVDLPGDEWGGDDVFEYLLHIKDRSDPVTSARFLSYIAPYWFCGDTDSAIRFRPSRLQTLSELIEALEQSRALNSTTVTDCILCAGAAMDFPLHSDDLIRVDKSDYCASTFRMVVEHIHGITLARGPRHGYAKTALEVLLALAKKTTLPLVDAAWINELLKSAAWRNTRGDTFSVLLRLSARRKEEGTTADSAMVLGQDYARVERGEAVPQSHGGTVTSENPTPEYALLVQVLQNIKTCSAQQGGWQDEAVYGGLIAIRDIPGLRFCLPRVEFLQILSKAMEKWEDKGDNKENKPFRVRKAAYDIVLVARDGWLRSADLRQTLEDLDFPKKLHGVVTETGRSDHQRSFLEMVEILSMDKYWHPYLRKAMDIWLPLHREGPVHALRILANVGELLLPERDGYNVDKPLKKVVEDEWAGVPGRLVMDLTADRLRPLAKVTRQFKELLFTESDRRAVLAMVEQVIPSLERRREDGYDGPGDDIRGIVNDLLRNLRLSTTRPNHRRFTCQ